MSRTIKALALIAAGFLVILASDMVQISINAARVFVSLATLLLFIFAIRHRQYYSAGLFAIVVLLFNPFHQFFYFEKGIWRIIDFIVAIGMGVFFYKFYDTYGKGETFEKFVVSRLPKEVWVIEDWTKDKSRPLKRRVESDMNPDLTIRNINSNKRFAVECKFHSRFWINKLGTGISWNAAKHDSYKRYGEKEKVSVWVVIGVGGNPKSPVRLFVVPLEKLTDYKDKIVPAYYLQGFEKDPKNFILLE